MSTEWFLTRGPQLGEDLHAWCREQLNATVDHVIEEGYLSVGMQRGDQSPKVRFLLPDACIGDPEHERDLSELLYQELADHLSGSGDTDQERVRSAIASGCGLDEQGRPEFEALHAVLHEFVADLAAVLALPPPPNPAKLTDQEIVQMFVENPAAAPSGLGWKRVVAVLAKELRARAPAEPQDAR